MVDSGSGVELISGWGCGSASRNIQSASCLDIAATLAGIGTLCTWLSMTSAGICFRGTCFSGNRAGTDLMLVLSRLFPDEIASRFCPLTRAATKRLTSFAFKSGTNFKRRADSDWRVLEVGLEDWDGLVRWRCASVSSLDGLWPNVPVVVSIVERDLFLGRCGVASREVDRLDLSVAGPTVSFAVIFTLIVLNPKSLPVYFDFRVNCSFGPKKIQTDLLGQKNWSFAQVPPKDQFLMMNFNPHFSACWKLIFWVGTQIVNFFGGKENLR